jgi:hypothetical protein
MLHMIGQAIFRLHIGLAAAPLCRAGSIWA